MTPAITLEEAVRTEAVDVILVEVEDTAGMNAVEILTEDVDMVEAEDVVVANNLEGGGI